VSMGSRNEAQMDSHGIALQVMVGPERGLTFRSEHVYILRTCVYITCVYIHLCMFIYSHCMKGDNLAGTDGQS
jgi:hypothetical protein